MKFKKMLTSLLIAGMTLTMLAGCNKSSETLQTEDGKPVISLMAIDYEGSPLTGEHAEAVVKQMEEHTNTKVNYTFVPNDSYEDKLSLTLASPEDMPMIISVGTLNGVITSAAEAGAFWDLSEFIKDSSKYPNLAQSNDSVNNSLTVDGKLIGVYKARAIGRYGMGYRQDWADKLGLDVPETLEDVYNMMYQFRYGDPDGNGKDDTYGLSLCKYTGPFDICKLGLG